jgi:hypothetical protein
MVKAIVPETIPKYCSMVNLDSFGLGYPYILENASSGKLVKFVQDLGKEHKIPVTALNLEGGASSDSASFKKVDIPSITLSGLSEKWPQFMHTSKDTMEATNPQSVRVGYQFGLLLLEKIDAGGCSLFKGK